MNRLKYGLVQAIVLGRCKYIFARFDRMQGVKQLRRNIKPMVRQGRSNGREGESVEMPYYLNCVTIFLLLLSSSNLQISMLFNCYRFEANAIDWITIEVRRVVYFSCIPQKSTFQVCSFTTSAHEFPFFICIYNNISSEIVLVIKFEILPLLKFGDLVH